MFSTLPGSAFAGGGGAAALAPDAGAVTVRVGAGADRPVDLTVSPAPRLTIPRGRFTMGASRADVQQARSLCAEELRSEGALRLEQSSRCAGRFEGEAPQAQVFLPAFAIDRLEVTVAEYATCIRAGACRGTPDVTALATGRLPVEGVLWAEAESYCRWRGGRLPSEAEWEKAARGPGSFTWPWGQSWIDGRANFGRAPEGGPGRRDARPGGSGLDNQTQGQPDGQDGFEARAVVGSFPVGKSPFGVEDMAGNVWEWTSTYFARDPPQAGSRMDPRGPVFASERTIRGGSYRTPPSDLRVTRRLGLHPEERVPGVGFRCAYQLPGARR